LTELELLYQRGARQFKFIDRTFNLRIEVSQQILEFFLTRIAETNDLFVHFEMVPDRFPEELRTLVSQFPAGSLQFEIGIQTFQPEVEKRISRRQDHDRLEDNLKFLRANSGVHIHADLIVGLPGETMEQFGQGFDRLVALGPQEIQVGILKRLRGTPILRHDSDFGMVYSPSPPYELLSTNAINFQEMMLLKRYARFWDVVANRGRFPQVLEVLLGKTPFHSFLAFTQWSLPRLGGTKDMPLPKLAELIFTYLVDHLGHPAAPLAKLLLDDVTQGGLRPPPGFFYERPDVPRELLQIRKKVHPRGSGVPQRQAAHQRL